MRNDAHPVAWARMKSRGRFRLLGVCTRRCSTGPTYPARAMIELTIRLTDEQLAEIAERAAALVPMTTVSVSPWLNVAEAAEHSALSKGPYL